MKTHWRACDKTDFLGAADLEELFTESQTSIVLTIEKVEIKKAKVRGQVGEFRIATFKEPGVKPMILNITNSKVVKSFCNNSTHVEDWLNVRVEVYIAQGIKMGAETTEALRFKTTPPKLKEDFSPKHPNWKAAKDAIKAKTATVDQIRSKYNLTLENETILTSTNENK